MSHVQNLFFLYQQFTNHSLGLPFKVALQFSAFGAIGDLSGPQYQYSIKLRITIIFVITKVSENDPK